MSGLTINRAVFRDKVMGCWLGKNAGGTLGEPLEGKFGNREMLHVDWYTELPEGGIPNDDLELQLIWLQLILSKGPGLSSADFVEAWNDCISYNFDEYGLSKENMQKGLSAPVCGWNNNYFKDCMGSPIRSEIWACLAPGCPEVAARYAFLDAIVDHGGGESVYGEIFNAVLESAAFVQNDKWELLKLALSSIPADCLTYRCVKRSMDNYKAGMGYEDNRNDVMEAFYHPVAQYSPLNLGFQTIGWLYGEDFGDAICKAVNCGWDTDCTAATLGALLGILGGASSLPDQWIKPLGYEIATNMATGGIRNLTAPTDIRELTAAVCDEAERVVRYWGCDVTFSASDIMTAGVKLETPDTGWMKQYQPGGIRYDLGGLKETLIYEKHAAVCADRPSAVTLCLENPHPTAKNIRMQVSLPEGFGLACDVPDTLQIPAGGRRQVRMEIAAGGNAIAESNRGWILLTPEGEPAFPAVPLVLLGGSRWLVSGLFKGRTLDDNCGIAEDQIFTRCPEGFEEQWNPGNDLELGHKFTEKGVIFALHHIYTETEREAVLGVPNNGFMKLYVNGEMIHRTVKQVSLRPNLGNGGALGDLSNYKVTRLKQGWNQVLIKLEADVLPQEAHFTMGEMSTVCAKNHGMPLLHIRRSGFSWEGEDK